MTTFQDPQPQSRRAMRASERGDDVEPTTETPANAAAAQAPFVAPVPLVEPEVRQASFASPLPSFDASQFRNRVDARDSAPLAPTQALPQVDQPSYQPRDFAPQPTTPVEPSPFVSQPLSASLAAAAPPAADTVHAYEAPPTEHSEHTLTRRELRALRESGSPAAAEPEATPLVTPAASPESVVTPATWGQPTAFPAAAAPAQAAPAQPAPVQAVPAQEAPAQKPDFDFANLFEAPAQATPEPIATPSVPVESAPVDSSAPQAWPFGAPLTPTSAVVDAPAAQASPVTESPTSAESDDSKSPFAFLRRSRRDAPEPAAEPVVAEQSFAAAPAVVPADQPEVIAATIVEQPEQTEIPRLVEPLPSSVQQVDTATVSPFDALFTPRSADSVDAMPATQAWSAPVGHWSTQADLDDETQPHESTINRRVGTGSSATSALVLPSIPEGSDIRGPLTENGQITLTGSIDLSHALSSTGSTDRLENIGMDALFELHDAEAISTDSAPVRAIRAVSTHNTGHGVTHTQKPKGNRALTGLLIAASSMAVVVAGLLVAALAFNLF